MGLGWADWELGSVITHRSVHQSMLTGSVGRAPRGGLKIYPEVRSHLKVHAWTMSRGPNLCLTL